MPSSGLYKVDSLLSSNPALWQASSNTIFYSFTVPSVAGVTNAQALNAGQQAAVSDVLAYVSSVTGLQFQQSSGILSSRGINFAVGDIASTYAGWTEYNGGTSFDVVVDTVTYPQFADFASPSAREILLHEMGHVLGLDHPTSLLPPAENNTNYTLMSYNFQGGSYSAYAPYDLLALSWIYGGDGIGGTYGYGSTNGPVLPPEAYPPITHDISGGGALPEGAGSYSFTVTRAGNLSVATTVAWAVSGSVDAADFGGTLPTGVVSFAAGEISKTVSFAATDDLVVEPDENFVVTLGARTGNGAILGASTSASYTILDNDKPPVITIADDAARVTEGNAGSTPATFTITRTGNLGRSDTVNWTFSHGTTDNADFSSPPATSGSVTFAPGQASTKLSFLVAGDTQIEANETFFVNLNGTTWGTFGNNRGVGYIVNDDVNNTFTIAPKVAAVEEGNTGERVVDLVITRAGVSSPEATVYWSLAGTVNADDLASGSPTGGTVSFIAGQTTGLVSVRVKGDTLIENDEQLVVRLLDAQGLGSGLGTVTEASTTIINDDPKGEVSVRATTPTSVPEGNVGDSVTHTFVLTRSGDLTQAASIPWSIGGTVDAADFGAAALPSGSANFAAGASSTSVNVTTRGDALFEPDEMLSLLLGTGDLVVPSPNNGTASIVLVNDDSPNEVRVRAINTSKLEGSVPGIATSFQFEVSRIGDVTRPATVDLDVVGSGAFPASGDDFVGGVFPSLRITLNGSEKSRIFFVDVAQDTVRETDETFTVRVKSTDGPSISPTQGSAEATILTDEPLPFLAVNAPASSAEGNTGFTPFTFTITRTGELSAPSSVDWALAGTANSADFQAGQELGGSVTFGSFEASKTVTIQVRGDEDFEPDESLVLTLSNPQGAAVAVGKGSGTATILNDDSVVRVVRGTEAPNEKVVLTGLRADYAVNYEPATGLLRLVDQVPNRDGDLRITAIEALQFSDGVVKALPSTDELKVIQLAQTVLGRPGMTPGLWGPCLDIAKGQGLQGLATYAVQALFAGLSAPDMAAAVLANLNVSASTLQGANRQADFAWTVDYLTGLFGGDAPARGAGLLAVANVLGTLEADTIFGKVAIAFNDNIGVDWVTDLSGDPVTLVGLPVPLVPVAFT